MTRIPLATLAALAALASPAAAAQQPPLKVGVINLNECFDSDKCEIAKEVNAELKTRQTEGVKKLNDLKKRGQDLKNDLDALPAEGAHALREEKEKKLAFVITEIKYEEEAGKKRYFDYYKSRKVEIYGKISDAVVKVAAAEKLDLVLRMEPPILEDLESQTEARRTELAYQRINNRFVLFNTGALDITAAVIKTLNEDHKKK